LGEIYMEMTSQLEAVNAMLGGLSAEGTKRPYENLLRFSEHFRIRAVSALVDQYQRMAIAVPLRGLTFLARQSVAAMLTTFRRRGRPADKRHERA
jgi:hypothetical protein